MTKEQIIKRLEEQFKSDIFLKRKDGITDKFIETKLEYILDFLRANLPSITDGFCDKDKVAEFLLHEFGGIIFENGTEITVADALSKKFSQPGMDEDKVVRIIEAHTWQDAMENKYLSKKEFRVLAQAIINSMGKGGNDGNG